VKATEGRERGKEAEEYKGQVGNKSFKLYIFRKSNDESALLIAGPRCSFRERERDRVREPAGGDREPVREVSDQVHVLRCDVHLLRRDLRLP
jgi:hypothetical protein